MTGISLLSSFFTDVGVQILDTFIISKYQMKVCLENKRYLQLGGYGKMTEDIERNINIALYVEEAAKIQQIKSFMKGLIFIGHFCDFYHEFYLNKRLHITRENFQQIDKFICNATIRFITHWMNKTDELKVAQKNLTKKCSRTKITKKREYF